VSGRSAGGADGGLVGLGRSSGACSVSPAACGSSTGPARPWPCRSANRPAGEGVTGRVEARGAGRHRAHRHGSGGNAENGHIVPGVVPGDIGCAIPEGAPGGVSRTRPALGAVDRLAQAIRQAFREAHESFRSIATPLEMHEFVAQVVDPITLLRDGTVVPGSIARPRQVHQTRRSG
jgi:hypothetical protein